MPNFKVTNDVEREGSSRFHILKNKETGDKSTAIYVEIPMGDDKTERLCIDFKSRTRFDVSLLSDEKTLEYSAGTHTMRIKNK